RQQDCRYDQLEVTPAYELDRVFGARDGSQPCRAASQGSQPGSGGSSGGRSPSGTLRRLIRMRVQLVDRPRIESTRTSSTLSRAAASGYRAFQRSRPASASALRAALATVMSGWVDSRWPRRSVLGPETFRRDGATRSGSSRCFL